MSKQQESERPRFYSAGIIDNRSIKEESRGGAGYEEKVCHAVGGGDRDPVQRGPPKTCKGTPAKDTITGSGRADNIFALCSPDSVDGNGGDDLVKGGKGYDLPGKGGGLEGGPGDDKVMGQRGDDTVQDQV